jgi:hypothetical protein
MSHQKRNAVKSNTKSGLVSRFLFVAYALLLFYVVGCGGSSNNALIIVPSATPTPSPTASPTPTPPSSPTATPTLPPPFAKGEGELIGSELVVTYPPAASAPALALNTFYVGAICDNLTTADCTANKSGLNTTQFGNFDVDADPIGKNPLGIESVDAVKIDYTAININGLTLKLSGGIVIPKLAPASLKGLVLYFHETTVLRTNVPSNFLTASNAATADTDGTLLAAVWASQGYVVVMPDYIGLGDDTSHPHPYVLYPQQNAQSGLAMVKAARSYLTKAYGITGTLPLHVTGYSEGGPYSLEAAHLMQNNPGYAAILDVGLADAVPLSGAFDLTGTMLPYLFYNISTANTPPYFSLTPVDSAASKPYLTADIVLGFASYSGIAPIAILSDALYNCSASACGSAGNLDGLYYATNSDGTVLFTALTQALMTGWGATSNAITPLLTETYANALMEPDPGNPLYQQANSANTYLFVPNFPVTITSLMQDSIVTRKNSDVAFTYFTHNNPAGPYQEDLVDNSDFQAFSSDTGTTGEVDHTTELPFMSVLMLNQFNRAK